MKMGVPGGAWGRPPQNTIGANFLAPKLRPGELFVCWLQGFHANRKTQILGVASYGCNVAQCQSWLSQRTLDVLVTFFSWFLHFSGRMNVNLFAIYK